MSSFHVPHDQGDGSGPSAARRGPAVKHTAPGRQWTCAAHPAACWSQDTIPKPEGLATAFSGAASNGNRTQPEPCSSLSEVRSWSVRLASVARARPQSWASTVPVSELISLITARWSRSGSKVILWNLFQRRCFSGSPVTRSNLDASLGFA